MKKVLIDPGHAPGNLNRGPTGYYEYEGVWKVSMYLKEVLTSIGIHVDFTRQWHEDPGLMVRGRMAFGYDLFISEHTNAYNTNARGVEVFYDFQKPQDKIWADKLSKAVSTVMSNPDRGGKIRTYTLSGNTYNYYGVIRGAASTDVKHIFIIESGYHDNYYDEAFLKVDANLKRIAETQAKIICEMLGVNEMTVDEAAKIIKEKAGLDDNTIQYLKFYKYGDILLEKLARAMK